VDDERHSLQYETDNAIANEATAIHSPRSAGRRKPSTPTTKRQAQDHNNARARVLGYGLGFRTGVRLWGRTVIAISGGDFADDSKDPPPRPQVAPPQRQAATPAKLAPSAATSGRRATVSGEIAPLAPRRIGR
jgi:hypothetical protein